MNQVELLAPAKNFKVLKAAIPYADSFYFGVRQFNMRMQADNFAIDDLPRIMKFLHEKGRKGILTTNILIYENELEQLEQTLKVAKQAGVDAIIVHDFATIQLAKEMEIPFHISTQCNVSNSIAAKFYEKLGAERIILARECSLEQIKEIKKKTITAKIEVFIHGAMCTSISGRCYFSLDIDGKSANRGECAQPCRRQWRVFDETNKEYLYDGERFLNSRDLCMVAHIPKLIEADIDCFKIEGRMRGPYYVEVVTKVYREAIEAYYQGIFSNKKVKYWIKELKKVYNRGFTTGFYFGRPTEQDHQHKSPSNLSHFRMIKLGTIEKYSPDTQLASINLTNGQIKIGDEIFIIGSKSSDTYFHQKIEEMFINGEKVSKTPSSNQNTNPIKVETYLHESTISGDNIYFFTELTYKKHRIDHRKYKRKADYYRLTS